MRKSSLRYSVLFCASAVILSFCGCAVGKPLALSEEAHLQQLRQARPQGLGYSVAVAPVLVYRSRVKEGSDRWPLTVKAGDLQREITAALREVPVFTDAMQVSSPDLTAAREKGAQLLLKVGLSNCTTSFGGANAYFIPNMLVWAILSPVASAFVADEFYSVGGSVTAQLVDTAGGEQVWSRAITLQERYNLNDWQRGPTVWDFFFIAPFYTSWTPQKVDTVVLPHVIHKIKVELAKNILADLPPPRRSFAVAVGLNSCGLPEAPELKYAEKDAADFAEALSDSGFDEIVLLEGMQATRSAIESSLKEIAARTDVEVEDLVVYFAGPGTRRFDGETSTASLLTYGTSVQECEMSLARLLELLSPIRAENKVVVIDAGFAGGSGRTFPVEKAPAGAAIEYPEAVLNAADAAFLMACAPDETAHEFDDLQHGVFTHFLLQRGLAAGADLNNDGAITVQEALKSLAWPVTRHIRASVQGGSQKPCALGANAESLRILKLK